MKRRIALFAIAFSAFVASFAIQQNLQLPNSLRTATSRFETLEARFCLTADAKTATKTPQAYASTTRSTARVETTVPFRSQGLLIGDLAGDKLGDCFTGRARFAPGFSFSRIFFIATLVEPPKALAKRNIDSAQEIEKKFRESNFGVTPDAAGLVAGLAIGDTSGLSDKAKAEFKVLSLTHLTAVSGTNCAIILSLLSIALKRIRYRTKTLGRISVLLLIAVTLWGYIAIVGSQPSVLRAGSMVLAVKLVDLFGRKSNPLNSLLIAASVLAIFDPWLVLDYGFILSVLACLGILVMSPKIAEMLKSRFGKLPRWLALSISVSFAAQTLCFPVLLLLQPGFSTYALVANLLAEPIVLPITVLGILAVLASPFSSFIAGALSLTASFLAAPILWVVEPLANFPLATGFWPNGPVGFVLAIFFSSSMVWAFSSATRRAKVLALILCFATLSLVALIFVKNKYHSSVWLQRDWVVVSCDVGQGDATVIRSRGKVALIDVGRNDEPIDRCLAMLGIKEVNLLVLTHFDLDHVGGLSGAIDSRKIDSAMLSPFKDFRAGANQSRDELEKLYVPIVLAQTGLNGRLGDFRWQVLSPHAGAPEADSANDGSITMLWRSAEFDVMTLADLGEKGQLRLLAESSNWLDSQFRQSPLVLKVSHHGSADQSQDFLRSISPKIALISVGKGNPYGHPTAKTLGILKNLSALTFRTDENGSISVAKISDGFRLGFQGEQG